MSGGVQEDSVHTASECVATGARQAFAFLADGLSLGRWALGCFGTKAMGDGLFVGHSLFDGKALYVRIAADAARLAVTYHVGPRADRLSPRIEARVAECEAARTGQQCVVSLIAERTPDMTDERWRQLRTLHAAEILLVKALLERERDPEDMPADQSSPIR
jgi:hypothetical protein